MCNARAVPNLPDRSRESLTAQHADGPFRKVLRQTPDALEDSFARLVKQGPLPVEGIEVTRAVLLRLSEFYNAQQRIKVFLAKQIT
jgi:hypothetical protein